MGRRSANLAECGVREWDVRLAGQLAARLAAPRRREDSKFWSWSTAKGRKIVSTEHARLKQKRIGEIKKYLQSHGLIQVGTSAPDDVIRQLYENAVLSGKIKNINNENMIYNYMNDKLT